MGNFFAILHKNYKLENKNYYHFIPWDNQIKTKEKPRFMTEVVL